MKKLIYLLLPLCVSVLVMTGCSKDNNGGGDGGGQITLPNQSEQTQTAFADEETTGGFTFEAQSAWQAFVEETAPAGRADLTPPGNPDTKWLRLLLNGEETYSGGAGRITLTIELDPNYTGETRSATIVIRCGDSSITIAVTQEGTTEEGEVPEDPDEIDQPSEFLFTYSLHNGQKHNFLVDELTFSNNRLKFYCQGAEIDFYADFHFDDGTTLPAGFYEYSPDKKGFTCDKGYIGGQVWYAYPKGVIEVEIGTDGIYDIWVSVYTSTDSENYNGEITGRYRGPVMNEPVERPANRISKIICTSTENDVTHTIDLVYDVQNRLSKVTNTNYDGEDTEEIITYHYEGNKLSYVDGVYMNSNNEGGKIREDVTLDGSGNVISVSGSYNSDKGGKEVSEYTIEYRNGFLYKSSGYYEALGVNDGKQQSTSTCEWDDRGNLTKVSIVSGGHTDVQQMVYGAYDNNFSIDVNWLLGEIYIPGLADMMSGAIKDIWGKSCKSLISTYSTESETITFDYTFNKDMLMKVTAASDEGDVMTYVFSYE